MDSWQGCPPAHAERPIAGKGAAVGAMSVRWHDAHRSPGAWRPLSIHQLPGEVIPLVPDSAGQHALGEFCALGRGAARLLECRMHAARIRRIGALHCPLRLVFLLDGCVRIQPLDAPPVNLAAGEIALVDTRRVAEAEWNAHRALWLLLPQRSEAEWAARRACTMLPEGLPAVALRTQMQVIAEHARDLAAARVDRMVDALIDLAGLAHASLRATVLTDGTQDLFRAAQTYLQAHAHRTDLRITDMTRALGCSRTSLYRIFAARSLTVAGYLRELRLHRCRHALATASARSNIGQIAYRYGFADLHAFSRLFKQRFGITPGQARGRPDDLSISQLIPARAKSSG